MVGIMGLPEVAYQTASKVKRWSVIFYIKYSIYIYIYIEREREIYKQQEKSNSTAKQEQSKSKASATQKQSECEATTKQEQSKCKASAKQVQSKCKSRATQEPSKAREKQEREKLTRTLSVPYAKPGLNVSSISSQRSIWLHRRRSGCTLPPLEVN